jgi:7-cyano-7-deazaguanine synthase
MDRVVIVFSGGQDSTTCLYWALKNFYPNLDKVLRKEYIQLVTFDYGQRHSLELESAKKIAKFAQLETIVVNISEALRGASSLLGSRTELLIHENLEEFNSVSVPQTFVPARNLLFLSLAANIAYDFRAEHIVTGVCETDYAGYFDCRQTFIDSMQNTINLALFGTDKKIQIHTPLMYLNKADTVRLARDLGDECMQALAYSHTCYSGVFPPCGKCHACHLRARGFKDAGVEDPIFFR